MNKGPPRKVTVEDMSDALAAPTIVTPGATEISDGMVKSMKRKRDRDRMDPRKARRPELPVTGPGRGGRVGASATQHLVQSLVRDSSRDDDVSFFLFNMGLSPPQRALCDQAPATISNLRLKRSCNAYLIFFLFTFYLDF